MEGVKNFSRHDRNILGEKKIAARSALSAHYKTFAQGPPGKILRPALLTPSAFFLFFSVLVETLFFIYIGARRWHNGS